MPELDESRLRKFRDEFARAERLIKDVEEFCDEVAIPAINELRYAGFHISGAIVGDASQPEEELEKAILHCHRSIYDAGNAGIIAGLEIFDEFAADYRAVIITGVIPDWLDKLQEVNDVRDKASNHRLFGDEKSNDFDEQEKDFYFLRDLSRQLDIARTELNKKVLQERRQYRRFVSTVLISVAGILAAIVVGIAAL